MLFWLHTGLLVSYVLAFFVVVYVFVAGGMHLRIAAAKPLRGHQASAGQHLLQLPGHLHQAKLRPPCRAPPQCAVPHSPCARTRRPN